MTGTMSPSRVRHMRAVMSGSSKWALATGVIRTNPAASTLPLPTARSNVKSTDPAEWKKSIGNGDQVKDGLSSLIRFIGVTGCRLGEALALTWPGVQPTIRITKAISAVPGGVHVKDTKTHRDRSVPIGAITLEALEERRRIQQQTCAEHGLKFLTDGSIWSIDGCGTAPWRPDTPGKWIAKTGILASR